MMGPCSCFQGPLSPQNGVLPASREGVKRARGREACAWRRRPREPQESIPAKEPLAWSQAAQWESGRE